MTDLIKAAKAAQIAGKVVEAEKLYQQAVRASPRDIKAYQALIQFFLNTPNALPGAFAPLKSALALAPKSADIHLLAAQAYFRIDDFTRGRGHAETAVKIDPKNPEAHYVLGHILERLGYADEALLQIDEALKLSPKHRHALRTRASILKSLGRMTEATEILQAQLRLNPHDLALYSQYSRTQKLAVDDPVYEKLKNEIVPVAQKKGAMEFGIALRTLAKFEEDQGNHTAAFRAYAAAKKADPARPDINGYRRFVEAQVRSVSKADYFGWQASEDDRPVLIVGMPRSGSTLLEQILSGHPQIGGIGESLMFNQIFRGIGLVSHDGPAMVSASRQIRPDQAKALAAQYSAGLDAMQPDRARVVDKFLHNFERLGLIAKLFPKARILHAVRDPMDNCVACYMNNLSKWHSYTQDLTSLGRYYVEHRRLMDHWKTVIPNPVMEVRYEDVVADTEGKAREVIEFLGLEWDPNCLRFQENDNKARTLSAWQVRQPIYSSSVKRWQRYEEYLDPLKVELKGFYPDGF